MLKHVLFISLIEIKSYLRDRIAVFWTFIYPVLLLIILSYIFGSDAGSEDMKQEYSAYLISGMVSMAVVTTALFGFSVVLVSLRHEGKLKLYEVFPIKKISYLLGFAFSRILIIIIFSFLFVILSDFFYKSSLQFTLESLINYFILVFIGGFSFICVGLLIVSVISRPSTAAALINIISMPIFFLSDLFIPISLLPEYAQIISMNTPVYIFADASRDILNEGLTIFEVLESITILLLTGFLSLFISIKTFKWSPSVI